MDKASDSVNYYRLLKGALQFSIFIKNNIYFPQFGVRKNNYEINAENLAYIEQCLWRPDTDAACPKFIVSDIMDAAGIKDPLASAFLSGAVISVAINYNCDFDRGDQCLPSYDFRRIDQPEDKISPGYNFRTAYYYRNSNSTLKRDLYKRFGLRFVFVVNGVGGRFSIVPLLIAFGSDQLKLSGCRFLQGWVCSVSPLWLLTLC
eukprot:m.269835 g.269835  ORF g.269835 m.269835 type:complete len:204 (+) comp22825_c0_seq16:236-847(+)